MVAKFIAKRNSKKQLYTKTCYGWGIGVFLLLIIFLPLYFILRKPKLETINQNNQTNINVGIQEIPQTEKQKNNKTDSSEPSFYQYDMLTIELLKTTAVCSDNKCPCQETKIPEGSGYLYISPKAVVRMTALKEGRAEGTIGFGLMPVLVCEQGAKLRDIDLKVAAEDAKRWWVTGKVPLRPTPIR